MIRFVDSNCMVGRYNAFRVGSFYTKERLIQEMGYYGISEALVFHSVSMENSPQVGNRLIVKETSSVPILHATWSLVPSATDEAGSAEAIIADMQRSNVKVVRLFPHQFHFDLDGRCFGRTLELLSDRRVPVIVDYINSSTLGVDLTDWRSVVDLCRRYPDLPVIVTEFRFRTNRRLYQAMESCPNLHIDLSALWLFRSVEDICRKFGAGRLLFGTRLPIRDPSCALGMVNYAMVSDEEKEMVAGRNLQRLMRGVRDGQRMC